MINKIFFSILFIYINKTFLLLFYGFIYLFIIKLILNPSKYVNLREN